MAAERVILSRELSLLEIKEIKDHVPDIELEAFVHGSICIAYSGRCLLSSYMDRRDANQGVCDNSSREKYKVWSQDYFIENSKENPGALFQIEEDPEGTYILNAKDLCMIKHLAELKKAGVISFKVEGRTKSEFYAAMVARSYRGALDDVQAQRPFNPKWLNDLNKLTNRGYHTAFMLSDPKSSGQNYDANSIRNSNFQCVGFAESTISEIPLIEIKNKIEVGQNVLWYTPNGFEGEGRVQKIFSEHGQEKSQVHSGAGRFFVQLEGVGQLPEQTMLMTQNA